MFCSNVDIIIALVDHLFLNLCNGNDLDTRHTKLSQGCLKTILTSEFEDMYSSMPASKNCHIEFVHVDKA